LLVGDVAQRESASLARRRSGVQVPSSPPKIEGEALDKILFLVYTVICKRVKRQGYGGKRRPEKRIWVKERPYLGRSETAAW
jgi:hypothetical protein